MVNTPFELDVTVCEAEFPEVTPLLELVVPNGYVMLENDENALVIYTKCGQDISGSMSRCNLADNRLPTAH